MVDYTGELAALGTALSFAFGSTFFTLAGREAGAGLVNRMRLLVALVFIIGLHWLTLGEPLPTDAGMEHIGWLALSGVIGLALGDASLFQAFVRVGPRISMLIMALAPVLATIMAWVFLGERLAMQELIGIALAIGGIAWVVLERTPQRKTKMKIKPEPVESYTGLINPYTIGLVFAFGGALGQATGLITSKLGLADDFSALSGNLIRLSAATIAIWLFTLLQGKAVSSFRILKENPRAFRFLTLGAIVAPVFGVWLSLIAVQRAPVGVASTLMALTPIFLLPISFFVFGDKITLRTVGGTFLAFVGTVLLFV